MTRERTMYLLELKAELEVLDDLAKVVTEGPGVRDRLAYLVELRAELKALGQLAGAEIASVQVREQTTNPDWVVPAAEVAELQAERDPPMSYSR